MNLLNKLTQQFQSAVTSKRLFGEQLQESATFSSPEVTIYVWRHTTGWPYYITNDNVIPHKYKNKLTVLEYFRRGIEHESVVEPLVTLPSFRYQQLTSEAAILIDNLNADLTTLGFPMFSCEGTPITLKHDSNLETVKQYMPRLIEFNLKPYIDMISTIYIEALRQDKRAMNQRDYIKKHRYGKTQIMGIPQDNQQTIIDSTTDKSID